MFPTESARPVSRRRILQAGLGLTVAAAGAGTFFGLQHSLSRVSAATDSVVVQWNNAALQAIHDTKLGPTVAARALAILHTCMYDAWTAYDPVAHAVWCLIPKLPLVQQTLANKNMAMSFAAYRALVDLFPTEVSVF